MLHLDPMPLEGGMFRETWRGPLMADGRPTGTSIIVALSRDDGMFSAMHRLPVDETWHFHLGSTIEMLQLHPDGTWQVQRLGADIRRGESLQLTVPAGTWMGASAVEPGDCAVFGCTMAPGFLYSDYEGGDVEELCRTYPEADALIRRLCRPGTPLHHPAR